MQPHPTAKGLRNVISYVLTKERELDIVNNKIFITYLNHMDMEVFSKYSLPL